MIGLGYDVSYQCANTFLAWYFNRPVYHTFTCRAASEMFEPGGKNWDGSSGWETLQLGGA